MLPPLQRQQSTQPPPRSQRQHAFPMVPMPVQHPGQLVVTPSQVTCPGSREFTQSGFTARQLVLALMQVLVLPSRQVTVALQVFSFRTTEAGRISPTPPAWVAQEAPASGSP